MELGRVQILYLRTGILQKVTMSYFPVLGGLSYGCVMFSVLVITFAVDQDKYAAFGQSKFRNVSITKLFLHIPSAVAPYLQIKCVVRG